MEDKQTFAGTELHSERPVGLSFEPADNLLSFL